MKYFILEINSMIDVAHILTENPWTKVNTEDIWEKMSGSNYLRNPCRWYDHDLHASDSGSSDDRLNSRLMGYCYALNLLTAQFGQGYFLRVISQRLHRITVRDHARYNLMGLTAKRPINASSHPAWALRKQSGPLHLVTFNNLPMI